MHISELGSACSPGESGKKKREMFALLKHLSNKARRTSRALIRLSAWGERQSEPALQPGKQRHKAAPGCGSHQVTALPATHSETPTLNLRFPNLPFRSAWGSWFWSLDRTARVQSSHQLLISLVTLSELLNLSVPQFLHP